MLAPLVVPSQNRLELVVIRPRRSPERLLIDKPDRLEDDQQSFVVAVGDISLFVFDDARNESDAM